ncbi:MAG: class A beta-lactamase, subclass A2, partial [Bacteroidota bacterium]
MHIQYKLGIIFICNLLTINAFCQKSTIENDLIQLIKPFEGKVGVSILNLKTNERIDINGNEKFPMQSVYKFPLAMAVFNQIDQGKFTLNQKMNLKKSDLLPDTHSPLRDLYPNGNSEITLKEIIEKTVSESDNNGCDFQFRLLGGCKVAHQFVQSLGIKDISIVGTEEEMHKNSQVQYENYATPNAMSKLLALFYQQKAISKASTETLWKMMTETITGTNRIKGLLPKGTTVGHKTGWSGADEKGFTAAVNDAGIVILPDGNAFAITIFISETYLKTDKCDQLAANISKLAYDHFLKK